MLKKNFFCFYRILYRIWPIHCVKIKSVSTRGRSGGAVEIWSSKILSRFFQYEISRILKFWLYLSLTHSLNYPDSEIQPKKFNGTSEKFEIPFLEHRILEPSRQHQLSQYAPQIEAYDVSFSFRLRVCWSAYAIRKNGCFTKISKQNHVLNTFS